MPPGDSGVQIGVRTRGVSIHAETTPAQGSQRQRPRESVLRRFPAPCRPIFRGTLRGRVINGELLHAVHIAETSDQHVGPAFGVTAKMV